MWNGPKWIECPGCHVGYQAERLKIDYQDERQFTVVCSNCRCSFDVSVRPRRLASPVVTVTKR